MLALALVARRDARAGHRRPRARSRPACWSGPSRSSSPAAAVSGYLHALDVPGRRRLRRRRTCSGRNHTARDVAHALLNTFIWPWDWWLGLAVCVLAAVGAARIAWRAPRVLVSIVVVFAPYAIFHLLFQETVTTRYALPLLPVFAYAAMAAVGGPARRGRCRSAAIGIAAIALMQAIPASMHYAREGAPVFRAFDDMAATAHGGDRVDTSRCTPSARRAAEWATPILPARVAVAPHGHEWLTLVALWQAEPSARVWFVADPGPHRSRAVRPAARATWRAPIAGGSSSRRSSAARGPTTSTGTTCSRRTGCSIAAGR